MASRLRRTAALLLLPACALRGADAPASDWSVHAQSTVIEQGHPDFAAAYSGPNSLGDRAEDEHTWTVTAFLGRALWSGAGLYFNPETSQGAGLSNTVGVAGFPNGEATHAGAGTAVAYTTARLFLRQTFGLGGGREPVADGDNQVAGKADVDRLTVTVGKFAAADLFDGNAYAHDPRTQFLNWSLMADTAWDYPANAKGYTSGLAVEWQEAGGTLRWAALMEPAEANGFALDARVGRAWGQVLEWERRYAVGGRHGAVRPLVYWNRADMGSYAQAQALATARPDVTASRAYRSKAGAGLSWDQELSDRLGAFARAGYNDGRAETWAFTEVDRTVSAGLSANGAGWGRADDTLAVGLAGDGLSDLHRRYLAAGGEGFIVGDGRLRYAWEDIVETYYAWRPRPALALSADYQVIAHPAYNRDRGPVGVWGVRLHAEY